MIERIFTIARLYTVSLVLIALAATRVPAQTAAAAGCRDDSLTVFIKARVTDVFTSGEPDDANRRWRYRLPGAYPSDVLHITADSAACAWARGIHNTALPAGTVASPSVFVFYVRGVYVVVDPQAGDHYMSWTFFNGYGTVLGKMAT